MKNYISVAFVGNPNCGKTTLFNAFTGANLKVANWPGVTVERKEGETSYKGQKIKLIDLPGIYSLTSYSMEEKVSRKAILDEEIDVIVNIVDASAMERNLYLTLQLLEMGKPVILALNMMDIVEERGMEIDLHRLPEMLGHIPVVPVSARKRTGLDVLLHAVKHHYEEQNTDPVVSYTADIEDKIEVLEHMLHEKWPKDTNLRWHALKILENDEEILKEHPLDTSEVVDKNYEKIIINQKYDYIEEIVEETLFYKNQKEEKTEKIDRILTHRIWGVPVFLGIMALVFFCTFTVGDAVKGIFEAGLDYAFAGMTHLLTSLHASDWLVSLIVDGIMAGVGGILTFLPNIFILFLALAVLEDSGYMARVAYVMDGIMGESRTFRGKGISPNGSRLRMYSPGYNGVQDIRKGVRQKEDHAFDPLYVLFGKTSYLCTFCRYVFWKVCHDCSIFSLRPGTGDGHSFGPYPQKIQQKQGGGEPSHRASGIQDPQCQDYLDLCVGKGKGLSDKSWNNYFRCIYCNLVHFELQYQRDGYRCDNQLRSFNRKVAGASACSGGPGNVADFSCP